MSTLFSTPKAPEAAAAVVEAPPAPALVTTPAPLPTASLAPLPTPTLASDPALAVQIDPTAAAAEAIAKRGRGIQGTIATSLVGVPAADGAAGADFGSNALLPQRKTLLGE